MGSLVFGVYIFRIVLANRWAFPLMSMKCSSLPHLISFCLQSIFADIRIATSAWFLVPFAFNNAFPSFTLSCCLSLMVRGVSWRHQKDKSYFQIQFMSLYLYWGIEAINIQSYSGHWYSGLLILVFFFFFCNVYSDLLWFPVWAWFICSLWPLEWFYSSVQIQILLIMWSVKLD